MQRLLKCVIPAALVASAPIPAVAQTWPAIVVSSVPVIAPQARTVAPHLREDRVRLTPLLIARDARPASPALNLRTAVSVDADEIPAVDLRPKDEWSDNQGLRVAGTRLAFKRRF